MAVVLSAVVEVGPNDRRQVGLARVLARQFASRGIEEEDRAKARRRRHVEFEIALDIIGVGLARQAQPDGDRALAAMGLDRLDDLIESVRRSSCSNWPRSTSRINWMADFMKTSLMMVG